MSEINKLVQMSQNESNWQTGLNESKRQSGLHEINSQPVKMSPTTNCGSNE